MDGEEVAHVIAEPAEAVAEADPGEAAEEVIAHVDAVAESEHHGDVVAELAAARESREVERWSQIQSDLARHEAQHQEMLALMRQPTNSNSSSEEEEAEALPAAVIEATMAAPVESASEEAEPKAKKRRSIFQHRSR